MPGCSLPEPAIHALASQNRWPIVSGTKKLPFIVSEEMAALGQKVDWQLRACKTGKAGIRKILCGYHVTRDVENHGSPTAEQDLS
jgi:hypothetical protein